MNTDVLMSKYEQNEGHMQQQYFIVLTAYTKIYSSYNIMRN